MRLRLGHLVGSWDSSREDKTEWPDSWPWLTLKAGVVDIFVAHLQQTEVKVTGRFLSTTVRDPVVPNTSSPEPVLHRPGATTSPGYSTTILLFQGVLEFWREKVSSDTPKSKREQDWISIDEYPNLVEKKFSLDNWHLRLKSIRTEAILPSFRNTLMNFGRTSEDLFPVW